MNILIQNAGVILRDYLPEDVEIYLRWMVSGKWRQTDAPWKREQNPPDLEKIRQKFLENRGVEQPFPRQKALIATSSNVPIGRLNLFPNDGSEEAWSIGIAICEDDYLGEGLGTEALKLWVDYQFSNSNYHRLGLETWSFNKSMIRVAEKVGFKLEGIQREFRKWQGEWLDHYLYGILRADWEG